MHGNGLLQKSSFSAAEVLASTSAEAAERGSLRCEACCWCAAGVLLVPRAQGQVPEAPRGE